MTKQLTFLNMIAAKKNEQVWPIIQYDKSFDMFWHFLIVLIKFHYFRCYHIQKCQCFCHFLTFVDMFWFFLYFFIIFAAIISKNVNVFVIVCIVLICFICFHNFRCNHIQKCRFSAWSRTTCRSSCYVNFFILWQVDYLPLAMPNFLSGQLSRSRRATARWSGHRLANGLAWIMTAEEKAAYSRKKRWM